MEVVFQTFSCAAIRCSSAQAVERAPACQSNQEPTQTASVRSVPISVVPDLKQNIVKNVIDLGFVTNYSKNDSTEQRFVPHIDAFKRFAFSINNILHQLIVRAFNFLGAVYYSRHDTT